MPWRLDVSACLRNAHGFRHESMPAVPRSVIKTAFFRAPLKWSLETRLVELIPTLCRAKTIAFGIVDYCSPKLDNTYVCHCRSVSLHLKIPTLVTSTSFYLVKRLFFFSPQDLGQRKVVPKSWHFSPKKCFFGEQQIALYTWPSRESHLRYKPTLNAKLMDPQRIPHNAEAPSSHFFSCWFTTGTRSISLASTPASTWNSRPIRPMVNPERKVTRSTSFI